MASEESQKYVKAPYGLTDFIRVCSAGPFGTRWERNYKHAKKNIFVHFDRVTQVKLRYKKDTPDEEKVQNFRITVFTSDEKGTREKPVVILLDSLALDAKIKVRCGSLTKYSSGDDLEKKGICGDFYFLFMDVLSRHGILYNKNSTNQGYPSTRNPTGAIGTCKHVAQTIRRMIETGFFGEVDQAEMLAQMRKVSRSI